MCVLVLSVCMFVYLVRCMLRLFGSFRCWLRISLMVSCSVGLLFVWLLTCWIVCVILLCFVRTSVCFSVCVSVLFVSCFVCMCVCRWFACFLPYLLVCLFVLCVCLFVLFEFVVVCFVLFVLCFFL